MDDQQDEGALLDKRSGLLADAAQQAHRLRALLEQADALKETGFGPTQTRIELSAKVAAEDAAAQSGKPHPIQETYPHDRSDMRPDIHLFVDESGQADDVREFDTDNDFFALGAIAISNDAHQHYRTRADQLKREFFKGGPAVILHASELRQAMKSPADRGGKFALKAGKSWSDLVQALEELVEQTEFTAFGIIIQKWRFYQEFTEPGEDPFLPRETYDLALHLLLERFTSFLASAADAPIGSIALEAQNPERDARHQLSIAETIVYGTRWVAPEPLQLDIRPGVEFLKKQPSHPLELSDMLANFLYQLTRDGFSGDRPPRLQQDDSTKLWRAFCSKFYGEGDLRQGQFGLKVFPAGNLDAWLNDFREEWRNRT